MAVTTNATVTRIQITGYSEVTPCNFTDVYNADKAGTYSLHARAGIGGVDGAPVATTNALRPTDYVVLGGASGDLYITITNWNLMTDATIDVIGTDRDGNAQTDSVVVNANGNFNTAMWFATVTDTQVTVFNTPGGGSFDYDLTQGQWGLVWKQGSTQFRLDCPGSNDFYVYNGWFADEEKEVEFTGVADKLININSGSHIRFGALDDAANHETSKGCVILFSGDWSAAPFRMWYSYGEGRFYSSAFYVPTQGSQAMQYGDQRFYNCIVEGFSLATGTIDLYNYYGTGGTLGMGASDITSERLTLVNPTSHCFSGSGAWGGTVTEGVFRGAPVTTFLTWSISVGLYLINCEADAWTFTWTGAGNTEYFYRQYTFGLRVVDADGNGIQNVTVSMDDRLGANVFSVSTDANGDIAQQTVTYGYYGVAFGNTIQPGGIGYSPHTVTISLAGYVTRTIVYTIDRQREEIEELLPKGPKKDIEGNLYMEINSVGDLLRIA